MKVLYNTKVKFKFLGSFLIFIFIMVIIGIIGISGMQAINEANDFVYENNYKSTLIIQHLNSGLGDVRMVTQKLVNESFSGSVDDLVKQQDDLTALNTQYMEQYEALLVEDDDRNIFNNVESAIANYRSIRAQVIDYVKAGNYIAANKLNIEQCEPACQTAQDYITEAVNFNVDDAQNNVNNAHGTFSSNTRNTLIVLVAAAVLAIFIGLLMSGMITNPLNAVCDLTQKIADGDLTAKVAECYLMQKNEIGILTNNVEQMKQSLISTVTGIQNSTQALGDQVISTNQTLRILNDRIADTSAATEELSAGTQGAGAAAKEMNSTAGEIERAVENVAEKAEKGAIKSGEIHSRAAELGATVKSSINKSDAIFTEIKAGLEKALTESKAVDEINALADAILGITSQTTLLALNASIEAARAGEAGRGFAVVANEISSLADNSKNTVSQIQEVTKVVMSAVNNLASSSNRLLNFVSSDVMNDYQDMLKASDAYNSDAVYISDMTSDLNATSEELLASVQLLILVTNELAQAAHEGNRSTIVVANQTTDISISASTIVENMNATENISNELLNLVNKFKV